MNRWIVLPLGLIVLGSGLLVYSRQRTPPPAPTQERIAPSAEEVAREVKNLKRELARIRANTPSVVTVVANGPAPSAVDEVAQLQERPDVENDERSPEERSRAIATQLDVRIASEPRDVTWSETTSRTIRDVMASNAPSAEVIDVECASSMCRVTLGHEKQSDQYDMALAIQASPPFSNGVYYHYESDAERPHTTVYVLREGRSFREGDEQAL